MASSKIKRVMKPAKKAAKKAVARKSRGTGSGGPRRASAKKGAKK
jgi:hypothetical protein